MPDAEAPDRDPIARVLVCIPTYNERENLPLAVAGVRAHAPEADILVLDDNSPDGTGAIADELAAGDPHVQVLHRAGKEGLGMAYLAGFDWGLERGYDAIVEMDADGSHQPKYLPELLAALADADLVIGSRYVSGGSVVNWPASRKALSMGGNLYIRLILGMGVGDATAGYRAYRASALRTIGLDQVESAGYCFQVDLTVRATRAGLRIVEVPIEFVEREIGDSKMNNAIVTESMKRITGWGLAHRSGQLKKITSREPRWHAL